MLVLWSASVFFAFLTQGRRLGAAAAASARGRRHELQAGAIGNARDPIAGRPRRASHDTGCTSPPSGKFVQVQAGNAFSCGLRPSGLVECWGNDRKGQATPPDDVQFLQIATSSRRRPRVRADARRPRPQVLGRQPERTKPRTRRRALGAGGLRLEGDVRDRRRRQPRGVLRPPRTSTTRARRRRSGGGRSSRCPWATATSAFWTSKAKWCVMGTRSAIP